MKPYAWLSVLATSALAVGMLSGSVASAAGGSGNPEWYLPQNHVSAVGDVLAGVLSGRLRQPSPVNAGTPCPAEASSTSDVQVNCRAEDNGSPQNTQSETSVVAVGSKVVAGFNDSLVCCRPAINLSGYSVSTNGGKSFTDKGDLPWSGDVQPLGDPSLATDGQGNIYYATLAFQGRSAQSLIALYEMPAGTDTFRLLSVPVNVGSAKSFFADKELLSIGRDAQGKLHFYLTWTFYAHSSVQGPVMLSDSTDGVHWRTTQISSPDTCAPTTPGSHPVPAGGTLYVTWEQFDPAACTTNPDVTSGTQFVATVNVASATVQRVTAVARVHGAGDVLRFCGFADLGVIETAPGHDSREFEAPASTIDSHGTLYLAWNDRPNGPGGGFGNATRIYLSYSTDGARTFSTPQVISGPVNTTFMNDRYQPAIVTDTSGLHATWYERVQNPSGGPDLLREDKENLTLATPTAAPVSSGEASLSTVPFPIYQTNPNQDPIIAACYMGDYNQVASNGTRRFATWGDNRNVVTTTTGVTENQADVFSRSF
ncbi:MAG TPA: hypothetical protein VGA04_23590 [Streptosporangiaceae bacterium]